MIPKSGGEDGEDVCMVVWEDRFRSCMTADCWVRALSSREVFTGGRIEGWVDDLHTVYIDDA